MNLHVSAPDLCSDGGLIDVETACSRAASHVTPIAESRERRRPSGWWAHPRRGRRCDARACPPSTSRRWTATRSRFRVGCSRRHRILPVHGRVAAGDVAPALPAGPCRSDLYRRPVAGGRERRPDAGARQARRRPPYPASNALDGRQHPPPERGHHGGRSTPGRGHAPRRAPCRAARRPGSRRSHRSPPPARWSHLDRQRVPAARACPFRGERSTTRTARCS